MAIPITHRAFMEMSFDLDGYGHEQEVEVHYTFVPGTPETGVGYLADPYGYDPGSGDEVTILRVIKPNGAWADCLPTWMVEPLQDDETFVAALATSARNREAA